MQFASTGTTPPIFVPHGTDVQSVRPALDYFLIRVHAAQACYLGSVWERARRLVVTSRVNLNHPALGGEDVWAIQRTRPIRRRRADRHYHQLGFARTSHDDACVGVSRFHCRC